MLVVARKLDEAVVIGGNITVRVVGMKRGTVRLAIDAPETIRIFREEVLAAIRRRDEAIVKLLDEWPHDEPPCEFPVLLDRPKSGIDYYRAAWRLARNLRRGPSHNEVLKELGLYADS